MASTEHNFSGALTTWRDVNLSDLQKQLDTQGIEIVDNQKESVVGRKALADKTKVEFKRIPDAEKLTAYKGLLKAYQTEIDSLTKRSKTAENAFLNVYKVLAEAPDPYPLLEAAVDQTVKVAETRELEAQIVRLREENADLHKRLNEVSSLEGAKKKAEGRIETLEAKMEDMIHEKVTQKENELHATYDERLRNYEERSQDLQKQVSLAKNQLRDLRTSNESNQAKLLDHSHRQDQEVVAKLAEVDMIVADLERANSRVATVERRNEILRADIESLRSGADTSDRVKQLQSQLSDLESEVERLTRSLDAHKTKLDVTESQLRKKDEEYTKELSRRTAEVEQVRHKLKQYADYDEIKRELEIMKYVEFAGLDDESEDADDNGPYANGDDASRLSLPNPNADKANAHHGKSLEALLATKNKRILDELAKFRVTHAELETTLTSVQSRLEGTSQELEKQRALNEKLENDLLALDRPAGERSGRETPAEGADALAGLDIGGRKASDSPARGAPIPFVPSSADTSILPIVTSQRDRFRQRNAELEEELRRQFQIITDLRAEIKTLQADNLKLYEKVRYMQSYREDTSTSQLDPLPGSGPGAARPDDNMSKWKTRYEESMNPFEAFRGREATRAVQNLNPIERGVLVVTRAVLANRRTRTFFICYALALHVLIMFTTYECATGETQTRRI
ncbi:CASP C terminal-domain-containing protein [Schizophyllum amplum]|uniref:Protein CASP n=1 Tax=Schizophyllum amplum TaxID=97359 RepID=A0A550CX70_9AGAR|nr:CASP C terminal-domain-containing protein [Auriculariopsis ampla]